MFVIPKKELIIMLEYWDKEDIFEKDIMSLFKNYGDEWYISDGRIVPVVENKKRKDFLESCNEEV